MIASPAFAGADLSLRRDLTSIVVVTRERARTPGTADHLIVQSIQTWDPKQSATKEVDFAEVRVALDRLPRRFPLLKTFLYDAAAESSSIAPYCRAHPRLSLIAQPFTATADSNMEIWSALVARLNARTIAIPRHDRLLAELRGLRQESFSFGSRWRVTDASRKYHRDVSFALALAVYAAGSARTCTSVLCDDAECNGTPPFSLGATPTSAAWWAKHPDPAEVDDDDVTDAPVITAPVATDPFPGWGTNMYQSTAATRVVPVAAPADRTLVDIARDLIGTVGDAALVPIGRVSAKLRQMASDVRTKATQAFDTALPTDISAVEYRRAVKRAAKLREAEDQEARERAEASTAEIRETIRREGVWFPPSHRDDSFRW